VPHDRQPGTQIHSKPVPREQKVVPSLPESVHMPRHVRAALWPDGGVLLDLRRGTYYSLNRSAVRLVASLQGTESVEDLLRAMTSSYKVGASSVREDAERCLQFFLTEGLIEPAPRPRASGHARTLARTRRAPAAQSLGSNPPSGREAAPAWFGGADQGCPRAPQMADPVALAAGDRVRAGLAVVAAYCMTELLPLDTSVRSVAWLKRFGRRPINAHEYERLGQAVSWSGPSFFMNLNCLSVSLAATLFALSKGFAVTWCLGVRRDPFEAHAWVEAGQVPEEEVDWAHGGYRRVVSV